MIISISCDDEAEDILHIATLQKKNIVMLQVDVVTGSVTEVARYTGFSPKYAFPTEDKTSIYLIHQDSKTKTHKLFCARYMYDELDELEVKSESEDSDESQIVINRSDIEPIGELGTMINLLKIFGNKLIAITSTDDFKSTLTVYDNIKSLFLMKQEAILKQGKRVEQKEFEDFYSFHDESGTIADCFDAVLVDDEKVYTLKNIEDDSVDVSRLYDDSLSVDDTTFTITEIQYFRFHYPFMGMIKGGNEIFIYDFTKGIYAYCRTNSPIVCQANTESIKTSITFRVLIDMGDFYTYAVFQANDCFELAMIFSKRFIEKNMLVKEKIITFYDPIPCKWDGVEEEDPGLMIQSINHLQMINLVRYKRFVREQTRYKVDDIKHLNGIGFIIGKRGDKYITYVPVPVKIDDRKEYINLYQSSDTIRSIDYNFEGDIPYLYLSDCDEYLKKFDTPRRDSTGLKLVNEYFTYPGFTGREIYRINDGVLFVKTLGVKLQEKYIHIKNPQQLNDQYRPTLDMVEDTIDADFPLVSQDVLMFCGKMKSRSTIFKQSKALILPSYTCPMFRLLPNDFDRYLKNEFFFYPKSTNEEYVVYQLNRNDTNRVEFAFYKQNGKYETSIFLEIKGLKNYSNANVSVSPNGKYIFYVEEKKPENAQDQPAEPSQSESSSHHSSNSSEARRRPKKKKNLIGKVCEIVSLRSKHESVKLEKLVKKRKNFKDNFLQRMRELINVDDVDFNFRVIREVPDVGNAYSLYKHKIIKGEKPSFDLFVTSSGSVILLDKDNRQIFFNEIDMYTPNKKKLGFQPGTKDPNTISTMDFAYNDRGVIAYSSEEIYFLQVDIKKNKAGEVLKVDFKINKDRLFIKDVVGCPDPRYILICLSTVYDELILLIWDLKINTEMYNYSLKSEYSYISKPGSKFGVILANDFYINLDVGLINYYFDHNFKDYPWNVSAQGLKMDRAEKTILYQGKLLMKEMYSECELLQSLIDGRLVYNEKTVSEKMSAYLMMMQIDGSTIVHLYSIDFVPLSLMLNYMEKRKPYMLNSILMQNNKGLTPIDMAIKFESMKTINLLLQYLSKLKEASYSRLIQSKFNKLLSMNLISFHTYLESCFFQTIQMKGIKFLKMKKDESKLIFTHTSCLIDESFLSKNTNEGLVVMKSNKNELPKTKKKRSAVYEVDGEAGEAFRDDSDEDEESPSEIEIPSNDTPDADENEPSESEAPPSSEANIVNENQAFEDDMSRDTARQPRASGKFSHNNFESEEISDEMESEEEEAEANSPDSDELSDSEEEEGGEEHKIAEKDAADPNNAGKEEKKDNNPPAYNPWYNVFTTENRERTTELKDKAKSMEMEDYYRKNVSSDELDVRKFRTARLVPPNEIRATEREEKRLRAFERKMHKERSLQRARTLKSAFSNTKSLQKLDTKNMTREQLQAYREQERAAYYRENIKKNLPILNIRALEFDWLFGKQGAAFLKTMAETDSIELFSLNIIKEIILFFWQYYKIRIIIANLIPFIINFIIISTYVTGLHWEGGSDYKDASFICAIITLVFAGYFLMFEVLYFIEKGSNYLVSFWNYVNLVSIGLNVATVVIDLTDQSDSDYFVPVGACAILMMWLKLFYFGRMFNSTATIVRMIIEISKDMVPFLVIVIILVAGFTNSFFIIGVSTKESDTERFTGPNIGLAFTYTWRQGLGDFNTDSYADNNFEELVFVLWILCTFFFLIVFLNLLIAVLSDSFDKIQETLENNLLKELAIMMKDNEILLNRNRVFKGVKYLIVIEKVLTNQNENSWGGRLDYVNKIIKKTRSIHFRLIDRITDRVDRYFDNSMTYRVGAMEQTTDKSLNYIVDKIDRLDNNMKIYKDVFTRVMALR